MKIKTKKLGIGAILLIGAASVILFGCDISLPQPKAPEGLGNQIPAKAELVVKHISLFRQGIAFDILDNNQSRDATGVVVSGNITKVNNDILLVEKKPAKQSIETFLANLNKQTKKGCTYTVSTRDGMDNNKINELILPSNCRESKSAATLIYIYNTNKPDKVIKIEQSNKYAGPWANKSKTKPRYESLQFL